MSAANFNKALDRELVYEGGFVNHPRDPGGPTNKGVTQHVYDGYRHNKGEPVRSVRQITLAETRDIYRRQYADKVHFDELPAGIDLVMLDGAINSGPSQATKWLQRALNMNDVDGDLGQATIAATVSHQDHDQLIAEILRRRLGMLQSLSTWQTFGAGWTKRVANLQAIGQAWASGSVGPPPEPVHEEGGNAKGSVADVSLPPTPEETGAHVSAGAGGLGVAVNTAKDQLQPLLGTAKWLDAVYAVLTVAAVAIALGGAAYWWWAKRKRQSAERAWSGEATADLPPTPQTQEV